jgi:hypothetical protein
MQPVPAVNEFLYHDTLRRYGDTFIETGSGQGDGIQRALDAGFEHVSSIEAYDENFMICAMRFQNDRRVKLYRGRSVDVLPRLLSLLPGPCVFFLDAHPSAENSYGYEEAARGDADYYQDTIIRQELALILADGRRHVILIDDMHGDSSVCVPTYRDMILRAQPDYTFRLYDENLSPDANPVHFYKDKILVACPEEAGA